LGAVIIEFATVLRGAQPFNAGNVNATYDGQVLLEDGSIRQAIIKDLEPRELANELMAAAVALTVGLATPTPYVAAVDPGALQTTKGPIVNGKQMTFATVNVQTPSLRQIVIANGSSAIPALCQELMGWDDVGLLYGFDSFVANIDRNLGNLLFGGGDRVWAIDHGHCFSGPAWKATDLQSDKIFVDKLKLWLTPHMSEVLRRARAQNASDIVRQLNEENIEELGKRVGVDDLLDQADFDALIGFLEGRKTHVPRIAADALGLPLLT